MKLLLDEHYSLVIAEQLRARGLDVVAVTEHVNLRGVGDEELLSWATTQRRVLLTNNITHFIALAREWSVAGRSHYGLVFSIDSKMPRSKRAIGLFVRRLTELMSSEQSADALVDQIRWL